MHEQRRAPYLDDTLIWRGERCYDEAWASMLWNEIKPQRFPDVIVRAASDDHVRDAIRLARSHGLRVALRGSGHSWCGSPLRDGGMLIDLSRLRQHTIDPGTATATVQPGVTSQELALALADHGLAFPTGHCPSVALSGFLLSGGLGWNPGTWGPACASVQEIEAVTADGEFVRCGEKENPDLFWAARGAGPGFFGAVTSFRLGLHPLPGAIMTTKYVFPLADLDDVADWTGEVAAAVPPSVELSIVLTTANEALTTDRPPPKVAIVTGTVFATSPAEATRSLEPLRACPIAGRALFRECDEPTPFDVLYAGTTSLWPERHRTAADTLWSNTDYGTLLAQVSAFVDSAPSDKSLVLAPISPAGLAGARLPDMAFSALGESYLVCFAIWEDQRRDEVNVRWLRQTMRAMEPFGTGHYIAEADLLAAPTRARRSFTPAAWERLRALRAEHDPDGVFQPYLRP